MQDNAVQASPPRVVIVTALNDADKKQEALSNGAEDYVLKPDLFERLPELLHPSQQG
jgi:response regulator of citrate/malate metabolism